MKNNIKLSIISIFIFLICTLSIFPSYASYNAQPLTYKDNSIYLVIDNKNLENIPEHFRKTTDISSIKECYINTKGLNALNISGSQQFTPCNIKLIKENINTSLPFIVIDLRAESHGFADCFPISWKNNEKNDANKGLSRNLILIKEQRQLNKIPLGKKLCFNENETCIIPSYIQNENNICKENNYGYVRITATDEVLPSSKNIDFFIKSIKNQKENCWYHFHCKEGIGRTTTFMIFYDMMKNYDKVPAKDIILRQIALVTDFTADDLNDLTSARRLELYNLFYDYCKKYGPDFSKSFEKYLKDSNLQLSCGRFIKIE